MTELDELRGSPNGPASEPEPSNLSLAFRASWVSGEAAQSIATQGSRTASIRPTARSAFKWLGSVAAGVSGTLSRDWSIPSAYRCAVWLLCVAFCVLALVRGSRHDVVAAFAWTAITHVAFAELIGLEEGYEGDEALEYSRKRSFLESTPGGAS